MIPAPPPHRTSPDCATGPRGRSVIGILLGLAAVATSAAFAAGDTSVGSASGLPVPRYVSLKPDRVTVRGGPTRDHEIAFVFTRAGLPVEITAESDNWRRIRDWEGSEGWVYHSLLSGKRTALVSAKQPDDLVPLYDCGASIPTRRSTDQRCCPRCRCLRCRCLPCRCPRCCCARCRRPHSRLNPAR
jgi:SH3-like domain-containing protein